MASTQPPSVPDRIVPLTSTDARIPGRVVYIMMRFDQVLDVGKLKGSLEELLSSHEGWRRLGARLRRSEADGSLEYHIPQHYSTSRPAVAFSQESHTCEISKHPLGQHLPTGGPSTSTSQTDSPSTPYVAYAPHDFLDLMRRPYYPQILEEYLDSDSPQIGLHVVSFNDATLVTFAWLHVLSDIMGVKELFTAWIAVLEGRGQDVKPVNDIISDKLSSLGLGAGGGDQQRQENKGPIAKSLPASAPVSATPAELDIERRVVCMPASYVKSLAASAATELEHMHQLAEAVSASEHDPFWVSSGDLTTAFIARVCLQHADPPPSPDDTINIINAMSMRDALQDDLLPAGTAHVGNA